MDLKVDLSTSLKMTIKYASRKNIFMKFLYNWLKKLLNTEKSTKKAPEGQLAHSFENVVVGKIMEIEKHPNADRLQVTKTDVGGKVL
jgi:phenylalanyl-tRNA synthetase beta chain